MNSYDDLPTDPDDELVSAYVDGEATPEEAARVEAEPRLRARADAFRATASLVAAPTSVDEAAREAAIAFAIAAHPGLADAPAEEPGAIATVTDLGRRRRATPRSVIMVSSAAAVLVVAFVVATLVVWGGDGDDATEVATELDDARLDAATLDDATADGTDDRVELDQESAGAAPQEEASELAATEAGDAAVDSDGAATTEGPADLPLPSPTPSGPPVEEFLVDAGPVDTVRQLAERARGLGADPGFDPATQPLTTTIECGDRILARLGPDDVIRVLVAGTIGDLGDEPHVAVVLADPDAPVAVVADDPPGCPVVAVVS